MHAHIISSDKNLNINVERIQDSENEVLRGIAKSSFTIKATAEGFSKDVPLRVGVFRSFSGKVWDCFSEEPESKGANYPLLAKEPLQSNYPLDVFRLPNELDTIYINIDSLSVGEVIAVLFSQGEKHVVSDFVPVPFWNSNKDKTITLKAVLAQGNPTIYDLTIETSNPDEEYTVKGWSVDKNEGVKNLKGGQAFTLKFLEEEGLYPVEIEMKTGEKVLQNLPFGKIRYRVADWTKEHDSQGAWVESSTIDTFNDLVEKMAFHGEKSVTKFTPKGFRVDQPLFVDVATSVSKRWENVISSKHHLGDWFECGRFSKLVPYFLSSNRALMFLVDASSSGPSIETISVGWGGCLPGELISLKFYSEDGKNVVEEILNPSPIVDLTPDERVYIQAILENENPAEYVLSLRGVEPDESFKVTGWLGDAVQTLTGPQTAIIVLPLKGNKIKRKLPPQIKEKEVISGLHSVIVELKNGQKLSVDLPYGDLLQPSHLINEREKSLYLGGSSLLVPLSNKNP